jgi:hypothetical protein
MRPKLVSYSDKGVATFEANGVEYDVPGLTRAAAESASVFEIRPHGRYHLRIVLEFEDANRPRVTFRNGRLFLRAVETDAV